MIEATQVGAFFDIDGTLLLCPSLEWRFFAYLVRRGQIPMANVWRWLVRVGSDSLATNKAYLRGLRESLVRDWEESLSEADSNTLALAPPGIAQIDWHLARQHRVFLVSGTLEPLAHVFARRLNREMCVSATRLECQGAYWTGAIEGQHMSGDAKAQALRALVLEHDLALDESFAYGNSMADAAMLGSVGHPVAVNPTWCLARVARRRGWATDSWRESPRTVDTQAIKLPLLESRRMP